MEKHKKLLVTGVVVVLALALVLGGILCHYSLQFGQSVRTVQRQFLILSQTYRARSDFHEAAAQVLRYDLTREQSFGVQYLASMDLVRDNLDNLDHLIIDVEQRQRLQRLHDLYGVIHAHWSHNMTLPLAVQKQQIANQQTVAERDEFDAIIAQMAAAEQRLVNASQLQLARANTMVLAAGLFNIVLTVLVTAFVLGVLWHELKRREDMLAFTDQLAKTYGDAPREGEHGPVSP